MVSALLNEPKVKLNDVAELFPGHGKSGRTNTATVWRWHMVGVRAADGTTVKLEAIKVGNRLYTSREAVERFILATNSPPAASAEPEAPRGPTARRKASDAAAAELERAGI